ncbi:MAG TPA: alpha/beta hydrolase family protein [Candidatus Binatia bacterium]|nr:alpha/beta hydrolase family protein [Candidatus Binatia bacterium]
MAATASGPYAEALLPLAADGLPAFPPDRLSGRPLQWLGTAIDAALVRAMRIVVERLVMTDATQADLLRRSAEPFLAGELRDDPSRFLAFDRLPALPDSSPSVVRRRLAGGTAFARRLVLSDLPEDPILLDHWVHDRGRPPATVLAIHGFTMGWPRFDSFALLAAEWFRLGLDVALITLPFHGARTPADARFSGDRFARPDVAGLNAAAARALHEILVAVRWLRRETGAPVGLLGLSLGGYLAATAASLDSELAFVVPIVPPACFGDLAWRFFPATRSSREAALTALTYEELRIAYRVHSPLTYQPRIARERLMIVAGRGDRIVPPEHPFALWRHWGEPAIHWFQGSHLAPFGRPGITAAVRTHLARIGVLS